MSRVWQTDVARPPVFVPRRSVPLPGPYPLKVAGPVATGKPPGERIVLRFISASTCFTNFSKYVRVKKNAFQS